MEQSYSHSHSAVVEDYTKPPKWVLHPVYTELQDDWILVEVEATTINPSDILSIKGEYSMGPLPLIGGKEGVGKVVKAGKEAQEFLGKRVSFCNMYGGVWSHYAIATTGLSFIIDEDVPVSSAASGVINPITVLGIISQIKKRKQNSIVHTAAASALGRMLLRICKTEGITVLNVVRRQEQADLLKSEGAEHVIVTVGDWETEYVQKLKQLNSKLLFDALGGGEIQSKLIKHHPADGAVIVYGLLEGKNPETPITIHPSTLISGLQLTGLMFITEYQTMSPETREEIKKNYSEYLKKDLSSTFSKEFKLEQIVEALQFHKQNPTQGKILLRP